ncbi:GNAT family N-acetyltransferase [Candidatus Zixiibacteriota bacterium]
MDITDIRRKDLEALTDFCSRNIDHDEFTLQLIEDKTFGDPHFDPELTLVGREGDEIIAFMPGLCKEKNSRMTGWIKWFAVDRERRRQGIGSQLLEEMERRLRQRGAREIRVSDSAPNYLQPGIDPRNTEAVAFLLKKGYAKTGDFFHMEADLNQESWETAERESELETEGFRIRRLEPGDRQAFLSFLGGDPREDGYRVEKCYQQGPISCHIALRGDVIVAYAQYDVDRPCWFGAMRTAEKFRRAKGLGTVLFKRCMADMRQLGYEKALIGWVAPLYFYSKVADARVCATMWLLTKSLES